MRLRFVFAVLIISYAKALPTNLNIGSLPQAANVVIKTLTVPGRSMILPAVQQAQESQRSRLHSQSSSISRSQSKVVPEFYSSTETYPIYESTRRYLPRQQNRNQEVRTESSLSSIYSREPVREPQPVHYPSSYSSSNSNQDSNYQDSSLTNKERLQVGQPLEEADGRPKQPISPQSNTNSDQDRYLLGSIHENDNRRSEIAAGFNGNRWETATKPSRRNMDQTSETSSGLLSLNKGDPNANQELLKLEKDVLTSNQAYVGKIYFRESALQANIYEVPATTYRPNYYDQNSKNQNNMQQYSKNQNNMQQNSNNQNNMEHGSNNQNNFQQNFNNQNNMQQGSNNQNNFQQNSNNQNNMQQSSNNQNNYKQTPNQQSSFQQNNQNQKNNQNQQNFQSNFNQNNPGFEQNQNFNQQTQGNFEVSTHINKLVHPDQKYQIDIQYPSINFGNVELTTREPLRRPQDVKSR